jgi:hypothetical protein
MDFSRPASGYRFKCLGMKVNSAPDALPEFKYPYLQNTRNYLDDILASRPQIAVTVNVPGGVLNGPVTALEPSVGVYKIGSGIFVNGAEIDNGYQNNFPCSIVPFRPNASPNAYDYVFDDAKGSKVFVPSTGVPVVQKIGIAESQAPPDMAPDYFFNTPVLPLAAGILASPVAGAPSDVTRSTEAILSIFNDPASVPSTAADQRASVEVGTTQKYQAGQQVFLGTAATAIIQDVIPPSVGTIVVSGIRYFAGNTGRCVLMISIIGQNSGILEFSGIDPSAPSQLLQSFLTSFRRGAIIKFSGGIVEKCFLLNATLGPSGFVCLELVTVSTHAAGETITVQPTLILDANTTYNGTTILSKAVQSVMTGAGVGTLDFVNNSMFQTLGAWFNNGFILTNIYPRIGDYIHFSVNVSDLTQLTSIRILFDVDATTNDFQHNAYYFDVNPNDLVGAVAGTQTQLGATAVAIQRQILRSGIDAASSPSKIALGIDQIEPGIGQEVSGIGGAGDTTTLGASQWSEIMFPISALTRIGNDQTRTLLNLAKIRFQITCTAGITVQISSLWVGGGGNTDVGITGQPYVYRVRPRNSATGARGNPSPATRFGVFPRSQNVSMLMPSASYDTQIDTWDIFRFGGQVTSWRYIGSAVPNAIFYDNVADTSILEADTLSFDQHEPFPGIGPPINSNISTVIGTQLVVTFPTPNQSPAGFGTLSQLGNMLPGTLINISNNIFTLWNRPTLISATLTQETYLFQLVENAGLLNNVPVLIQEPALANQQTNNVWGPDSNGVLFSVMAGTENNGGIKGLRPGVIQWTNDNDPDAASDKNTWDVITPSEPLQNGEMLQQTPVVFSSKRAWRGFRQNDGTYSWTGIPTGAGLAAQFAICSDGEYVYFVASDSIRKTAGGASASLTDDDLYNIFPHEGVQGKSVTYAGQTVFAPDYTYSALFQLNVVNRFLYFDYLDSNQNYHTLVCDLRTNGWSVDIYSPNPVTIHVGNTLPPSNQSSGVPALVQQLVLGDTQGALYNEVSNPVSATGELVACAVTTREEMLGDIRSNKMLGDIMLDALTAGGPMSITPILFGTIFATTTILAGAQATRPKLPYIVGLNGQQIARSIGLQITWTDQGQSSQLFSWQPDYINQPEDITNRFTDWDDAGTSGAKFYQGFILQADTSNVLKNITVRSADDLAIKQVFTIQHNGQSWKPYSFNVPFIAHMVRLEPDNVSWRMYGLKWITQPTPEIALNWITQATSHGLPGYQHVRQMLFAYNAPAPVVFTLTVDGTPIVVNLPATIGYQKKLITFPANKGLVFQYSAVSAQGFQVWVQDIEIFVAEWGRSGSYNTVKLMGAELGATATI